MTLLGKLFRPWDLSTEDQVSIQEIQKNQTQEHSKFSCAKVESDDTIKSSRNDNHDTRKNGQVSLTRSRQSILTDYQDTLFGAFHYQNERSKSVANSKFESESMESKAQKPHKNGLSTETRIEEHTLMSPQEMYLANSTLPSCCEPISPADFDIYYNGSSSNIFLYPNSNTINELASLSRHELTAMGLLPPEPASSLKVRRQRPKRFHCPHCQVAFSNNGQLRGHIRIHTGERPYLCEEEACGKSFTRNEELTRHRRIHSGLRPFPCSYCGKKFGRKDHLKKHTRTHQRGVYNPRSTSLIGYANPFQPFHQNLLSSTSFATPNELITLQSQYSAFSQHPQPLLPLTAAASTGPLTLSSHHHPSDNNYHIHL